MTPNAFHNLHRVRSIDSVRFCAPGTINGVIQVTDRTAGGMHFPSFT